ncbi:MAG: lysophospholipid acyltransferase family protein [Kiritimatiellia bacterium]
MILRFFAYLQYLLIRVLGFLYELIPPSKAYSLGSCIARPFYRILRERRTVAIENILKAGITESRNEADRIASKAFAHLGGHICEAFKVPEVINKENWEDHIVFECSEECRKLVFDEREKPFILVTGHIGAWETGISLMSFTRPVIAIARKMNNPFVQKFMETHHFRGAITVIDKNKGLTPDVIRKWKRTGAVLAVMMDQHAGRKNGILIDFMGRKAHTHTSPARLHLRSGIPVVVGAVIREGPLKYRVIGGNPIRFESTGNRETDIKELLTLFTQRLENFVRQYPEQYLWAHKRWRKLRPLKNKSRSKV